MKYFEQKMEDLNEKIEFLKLLEETLGKMREREQQMFSTYSVGLAMYGNKYDAGFGNISGRSWRYMNDRQREEHKAEREFSLKAAARIGAVLADMAEVGEIKRVRLLVRETGPSIYSF